MSHHSVTGPRKGADLVFLCSIVEYGWRNCDAKAIEFALIIKISPLALQSGWNTSSGSTVLVLYVISPLHKQSGWRGIAGDNA